MNYWSMTQGARHSIHVKHGRQQTPSGHSPVVNRMCGCPLPASSSRVPFSSSILSLPLTGSLSPSRTGCPAYRVAPPHSFSPICRKNFTSVPAGTGSPLHCSATVVTLRAVVSFPARPPRPLPWGPLGWPEFLTIGLHGPQKELGYIHLRCVAVALDKVDNKSSAFGSKGEDNEVSSIDYRNMGVLGVLLGRSAEAPSK